MLFFQEFLHGPIREIVIHKLLECRVVLTQGREGERRAGGGVKEASAAYRWLRHKISYHYIPAVVNLFLQVSSGDGPRQSVGRPLPSSVVTTPSLWGVVLGGGVAIGRLPPALGEIYGALTPIVWVGGHGPYTKNTHTINIELKQGHQRSLNK